MTGKRSRLQIYLEVLKTIKKGVSKPTNIMYKCNLSWIPLMEILNSLLKQGLINRRNEKKRKVYEITEKGLNVLRYFERAEELMAIEKAR
ncbi:MAG: DUF4364 family protein [Candidatus Bathyarchaeia archaeon]